jgi:hypothetical protein
LGASHPIFDIGERVIQRGKPFKGKPTRLLDLDFEKYPNLGGGFWFSAWFI